MCHAQYAVTWHDSAHWFSAAGFKSQHTICRSNIGPYQEWAVPRCHSACSIPPRANSDQDQQTRHVIGVPRVLNVPSAGQGLMVAVRAIAKQEARIYMLNAINMT